METIFIQFRKFKGEIICVFPYAIENREYVTCYSHIGQHSACAWNINQFSKQATEKEYFNLLAEVKNIYSDYEVVVIKKRSHKKHLVAYNKEYSR